MPVGDPLRAMVREPMRRVALEAAVMRPWRTRRLHSFGPRSKIHRPLWIYGGHKMAFGSDCLVLHGTWLSVETPAWELPAPVLRIGDRVGIRPYCMISAAESITIEDDVIIGAFSSVIDNDHTFELGRPNVMHNPLATAPVHIGRGTWLAERVAILRGAHIGRCCIVGANSVVKGTLPDFSIAVGAPARVVGTVEGVDVDRAAVAAVPLLSASFRRRKRLRSHVPCHSLWAQRSWRCSSSPRPALAATPSPYGTNDAGGFRNVLPPGAAGTANAARARRASRPTGTRPAALGRPAAALRRTCSTRRRR